MAQNEPVREPLVVPAWHDPKARTVVFSPSDFEVGIVVVTDELISFATKDTATFVAPCSQVGVKWLRMARPTRGCEMTFAGERHRFYFARPLESVPGIDETGAQAALGNISVAADLLELATGPLATFASVTGFLGELAALPGEVLAARRGIRNGDSVRQRLESAAAEA
ncbi:hypothetical protein [Cellulomonas fengjieae]|uniref:hypothetical protein n=1 Tax=Cellulomonas fengjieae TaxID=2819978 RepID=UPI001AAE6365|nr:hypothetical protein [Cellulomonas fengjieae]MBO3101169.1 hypothetical protein [Cellulomonas fengjieae]